MWLINVLQCIEKNYEIIIKHGRKTIHKERLAISCKDSNKKTVVTKSTWNCISGSIVPFETLNYTWSSSKKGTRIVGLYFIY